MSFLEDSNVKSFIQDLTPKQRRKLKKATYRAVDFIEFFLPHPRDYTKRVELGPYQKEFVDYIQYGFPLKRFRFSEVDFPPEGVIFITRRKVGKSWMCAYACAALMVLGPTNVGHPPTRCGIIAASEEEATLLIDKVKVCFDYSPLTNYVKGRPKVMKLELTNGSFVRSHTCSKKSIRGPGYDYLFIDESAIMDEEVLFASAIPTVEHGERWTAITTPDGAEGQLVEYYYKGLESRRIICKNCGRDYIQSQFPDKEFPHDPSKLPPLPDCEECGENNYKYGVGDFGVPFLDPWKCPIIDQKKLKRKLDLHGWSPWARQEFLGEIISEASMVILDEWLKRNTNSRLRNTMTKKEGVIYVVGVDYGRHHDASSICVTHLDPKTKRIVWDYMRTVSGEYDMGTDYEGIRKNLREIILFYNPAWVVADATGLGDPQVERLDKDLQEWRRTKGIRTRLFNNRSGGKLGFIISHGTKPDLIGNLLTKLSEEKQQLEIPPRSEPEVREFVTECLRFECEVKNNGYVSYGTQTFHDDRIIAYALSLWGHRKKTWYFTAPKMIKYNSQPKSAEGMYSGKTIGGYGEY